MKLGMPTLATSQPMMMPTAAPIAIAMISAKITCLLRPVSAMMMPIATTTGPVIDLSQMPSSRPNAITPISDA